MKKTWKRALIAFVVLVGVVFLCYRTPAHSLEEMLQSAAQRGATLLLDEQTPAVYTAKGSGFDLFGHGEAAQLFDFSDETADISMPDDGRAPFASLQDLMEYLDWGIRDETLRDWIKQLQEGDYRWWEFVSENGSDRLVVLWSFADGSCLFYESNT